MNIFTETIKDNRTAPGSLETEQTSGEMCYLHAAEKVFLSSCRLLGTHEAEHSRPGRCHRQVKGSLWRKGQHCKSSQASCIFKHTDMTYLKYLFLSSERQGSASPYAYGTQPQQIHRIS